MIYETTLQVETSKYGDGGKLNIRSTASANGSIVARALNGDPIAVNLNSESGGWIAVNYSGCHGYAMSKFIRGTIAYGSTANTGAGNYDGSDIDCKATTTQSIGLYTSADESSTVKATIPSGKNIAVDNDFAPFATWLRAVYSNKTGYVKHATLVIHKTPTYYGVKACDRYGASLLQEGSQNEYVRVFKKDLYDAGWNNLTLNNMFDTTMKNAVKAFQTQEGIASDGIIGTDTKEKMYRVAIYG